MSSVSSTIGTSVESLSWMEWSRLLLDILRPKVIALVVFTGLPILWIGGAWPGMEQAFWILLGTGLAGGASSALNAYVERDSDAKMARTRRRPLPASAMLPHTVLAYGVVLTVVSTAMLWVVGGLLAAAVGLGTIAFYVGVYTLWLKPRTPQNIVIGGAAGSTAPLIVSAALHGTLTVPAWILFFIVFLWTPPHFWAIALFRRKEYEDAGFPMMPSVVGNQPTRWRSLGYTIALVITSLLPVYFGDFGLVYGILATGLGVWFTVQVVLSMLAQHYNADRKVFRTSIVYLTVLYLAMLVDLAVTQVG